MTQQKIYNSFEKCIYMTVYSCIYPDNKNNYMIGDFITLI